VIKRIVSFALHQPLFVLFALIVFIGAGGYAFINLPV